MYILKNIFILLLFTFNISSLYALPGGTSVLSPAIISYLLSSDRTYYKPKQEVCEAYGGDWIADECHAKWDESVNICTMPTKKQWESIVTGCGGDLLEYDDTNNPYQQCYKNKGYEANIYWSSEISNSTSIHAVDFESGRIKDRLKTSTNLVRCSEGGKVLIPEVLPASDIYEIPLKVACESNGGDWNSSGYDECSAHWDEARAICQLPSKTDFEDIITHCGGDLDEYDDQNILYTQCRDNANYAPYNYWSLDTSTVAGEYYLADLESGRIKSRDIAHSYITRCISGTMNHYRPTSEKCEAGGGSWDGEECSANWNEANSICTIPSASDWTKTVSDCGGDINEYDDANQAYQDCYQASSYNSGLLYWSSSDGSSVDEKTVCDIESGRLKDRNSSKSSEVRCIEGGY